MSKERPGSKERLGSKEPRARRLGASEVQRLPRDRSGKLITPPTTSPSSHLFFRWGEAQKDLAEQNERTLEQIGSQGELQDEEQASSPSFFCRETSGHIWCSVARPPPLPLRCNLGV